MFISFRLQNLFNNSNARDKHDDDFELSDDAIVGITIGVLALIIIIIVVSVILCCCCCASCCCYHCCRHKTQAMQHLKTQQIIVSNEQVQKNNVQEIVNPDLEPVVVRRQMPILPPLV